MYIQKDLKMRSLTSCRSAAVLLVILSLLLMMGSVLPSYAQSATPSTDQAPTFQTIHMVSPTHGWAVVTVPDHDPLLSSDAQAWQTYAGKLAYVLHTEDGGQQWLDVTPMPSVSLLPAGTYGCDCSDNGVAGFFFLDDSHAWVMLDDAAFRGNQIFNGISIHSTRDGGQTWTNAAGMNDPYVISSSFVDPMRGWVMVGGIPTDDGDEPALLFRTLDGGMTWEFIADDGKHTHLSAPDDNGDPISTPITGITPMYHRGMAFESASSGWIISTDFDPGDSAVLHTTDGGVTWKNVPIMSDSGSAQSLVDCPVWELNVFAPSAITFLASCHDGVVVLYHSDDDGATWQSHPIPTDVLDLAQPKPLFMLNATTAWSIGCEASATECDDPTKPAVLYKTMDGGKTWDTIGKLPPTFKTISNEATIIGPQFNFTDDYIGWAIDPAGALYSTKDAGKTWTAIQTTISGLPS